MEDQVATESFDYTPRTKIVFGEGAVARVGELAKELGAGKILLVTDPGIVAAGHAGRVSHLLDAAGLAVFCYDGVVENPTNRCVEKCVEAARGAGIDMIIGLGGGSSMDTAKGCNFILTNGGHMRDYWGVGKARNAMLPLIAIPTTGGTGSECQSFALITDETTHQKMACGDPKAAARIAILDPVLTLSQPPRVTACTGIDAVAHAVETAVTRKRTSLSALFSREAFRLTMAGLPRVLQSPDNLEARGWMLLGAAWAGTAIENSMLGAAHSAANPLTARFGLVHGHAVGLMLPHVVRFNGRDPVAAKAYARLAAAADFPVAKEPEAVVEQLARHLDHLMDLSKLPRSLKALGVTGADLPGLAVAAASQWTAQFNPRPITSADFEAVYAQALAAA